MYFLPVSERRTEVIWELYPSVNMCTELRGDTQAAGINLTPEEWNGK